MFYFNLGFRLSVFVDDRRSSIRSFDNGKYYVIVYFDRGKITFVYCLCELLINWCLYVVVICLVRIKNKNVVIIYMLVLDLLNLLDRE